jgi:hypothetical protein
MAPINSINTTPRHVCPPRHLLDAELRAIPSILASINPDDDGLLRLVAGALVCRLTKQGHIEGAAYWAVHDAIASGRLRTEACLNDAPSWSVPNRAAYGPRLHHHGGDSRTRIFNANEPTNYDHFYVLADPDEASAWWGEVAQPVLLAGVPTKLEKKTPRQRGRPKPSDETIKFEEDLVTAWERARESGVAKRDFCTDRQLTLKELDLILDRVKGRERRRS